MRPPLSPSTAAGAALILLLLTACPERSVPRPAPPTGETPRHGGTLRVLLDDDVDSLDPDPATRASSWFFARGRSAWTLPAALVSPRTLDRSRSEPFVGSGYGCRAGRLRGAHRRDDRSPGSHGGRARRFRPRRARARYRTG